MDFFNAKALAAAESRCAALERQLAKAESDIALLRLTIHKMDDALFNISQKTDYQQARPFIAELMKEMEHRRKIESDRISSIIYSEQLKPR